VGRGEGEGRRVTRSPRRRWRKQCWRHVEPERARARAERRASVAARSGGAGAADSHATSRAWPPSNPRRGGFQELSGLKDLLIRVTVAPHARFSRAGYSRSMQ
jgi:hypothetical protein